MPMGQAAEAHPSAAGLWPPCHIPPSFLAAVVPGSVAERAGSHTHTGLAVVAGWGWAAAGAGWAVVGAGAAG